MNIIRLNTTAPDGFVKGGNGGNQGGGGSASGIEYLDLSGLDKVIGRSLVQYSLFGKVRSDKAGDMACPAANAYAVIVMDSDATIEAIGFDFTAKIVGMSNGQAMEVPVSMAFQQVGLNESQVASLPRLTKEEFYAI